MEHRIVELENFKLVGFKKESTNENRQGMKDCPHFGMRYYLQINKMICCQ